MSSLARIVTRVTSDETGTATLEYALVAGLIVVVCIGIIGAFGTKVMARWTSLDGSM